MATDILALADRLWRGEESISEHHPVGHMGGLAEICDDVAFVPALGNVTAIRTSDGLVLVDSGSALSAQAVHEDLRRWTDRRLHTVIYSHGHIDHVSGVPVWEREAQDKNWPAPSVIAHEAVPRRFDRYLMTVRYNEIINQRQFSAPRLRWPTHYRYPDQTYREQTSFEAGDTTFALRHEKGETDDHTVTWLADRKLLCCGDLFIWASPNAGNPQKVQRYPLEWAQALRRMQALGPEYVLPGHGLPVIGAERAATALADTAELLESLVSQTLDIMNGGGRLDEAIHTVKVPGHLADRPFLQPVYDEPEFVVRTVWRLYGGWWDGNPATLKPARERVVAAEIASLAGGAQPLAVRATELAEAALAGPEEDAEEGLRLAGHLVELAWLAAPDDPAVASARHHVFSTRADRATSTMARGVFRWAASESLPEPVPPAPSPPDRQ